MRAFTFIVLIVLFAVRPAVADTFGQLYAALNLQEIVAIMRQEGLEEAEATKEIYLKNIRKDSFNSAIDALYSEAFMETQLRSGLKTALSEDDAEIALAFYQTQLGALASKLETSARAAISNDAVEEMAVSVANDALQAGNKRAKLLKNAVTDMELTEYNLSGAFSARFAFLSGLAEAEELGITQDQIINLIAQDREALRDEIDQWVLGFVFMTYRPLSDEELSQYLAFLLSTPGKALNRALFEVFNELSTQNAGQLGKLLAAAIQAREL